jgi:hypothetical protein
MPEEKTLAQLLKALTEAVCQYVKQEIAKAVKVALEDVPERARRVALLLGLGLLLVVAGAAGLLTAVILILGLWLPSWGAFCIVGGVALLAGALLLRAIGKKPKGGGETP